MRGADIRRDVIRSQHQNRGGFAGMEGTDAVNRVRAAKARFSVFLIHDVKGRSSAQER